MENETKELIGTMSKANVLMYKALVVFGQMEKGIEKDIALENNEITSAQFKKFIKKYKTYINLRAVILYDFFKTVDKVVTKNKKLKQVNNDIIKNDGENYVYNKDFCTAWFNNFDKIDSLPKKTVFGSFYDFGNSDYLLHIEVSTMNLHIGFVKYKKSKDRFKVIKIDKSKLGNVKKQFSSINSLEERTWGLGWVSIDCNGIINLVNPKTFMTTVYFRTSDINKNILTPILEEITK